MQRIIVTGAKGGTGTAIVKILRQAGYEVTGIDLLPVGHQDGGYAQHNLENGAGLNDLFAGADGVVHFGSVPTDVWSSWSAAFNNITVGGFNVFQACANVGIKRLVYASSIEVYGDLRQQPHLPVREDSPFAPPGIYGASKVLLETLAADYCRWFGMSIAALRLNRIVYEGSYPWRLKPHTESDERAAEVLWGYVDARDVATACQAWLEADVQGFQAFNVAAEDVCVETPTRQLLDKFYPHITDIRTDFSAHQCLFDASALQQTLGWKAQYDWRTLRDEAGRISIKGLYKTDADM